MIESQTSRERMSQAGWSALIGGGLLLLFGLYYRSAELTGISDSAIYNAFVDVMVWTLIAGGVLNLASAGLLFLGRRASLVTDAVISMATGAMLILIGLVRLGHHSRIGGMDLQGILLLVFGGMFVRAGRGSWQAHASLSADDGRRIASREEETAMPAEGLKEAARDRLLRAKANLRDAGRAADSTTPDEIAPQIAQTAAPSMPAASAPTPADSAPISGAPARTSPPPAAPVEDGFLAELGRANQNERT